MKLHLSVELRAILSNFVDMFRSLTWCARTVKVCFRQRGWKVRAISGWADSSGCRLCEALPNIWAPEFHNEYSIDLEFWFVPREGYFKGVLDVIFRLTPQLSAAPRMARFGFQMFRDKAISKSPFFRGMIDFLDLWLRL